MHINKIHKTDGVNLEKPSDTFAKLFEAIPQDIPKARNKYPKNGQTKNVQTQMFKQRAQKECSNTMFKNNAQKNNKSSQKC